MLSQNLVQGCVKTWSKYVAQQNWTKFWLKKKCFFLLLFCSFFLKISFSLQKKKEDLWKTKKEKKEKTWTKFWLKKGYFWTKFWLYSIHTYIYIYQLFARFSQDYPRFVLGLSGYFPEIPWNFIYAFPFSPVKRATHKHIWPPPVPGTVPGCCLCWLASLVPQDTSPKFQTQSALPY